LISPVITSISPHHCQYQHGSNAFTVYFPQLSSILLVTPYSLSLSFT